MLVSRSPILLALLVAITGSSAQISNFSSCGQACLVSVLSGSVCGSITNVTCLCTDTTVQASLSTCLGNCSAADLAAAESLEKSYCSNATSSTTTSPSASQASVTRSSSSSAAASTSTSTNNAASPVEQLPFISTVITIAGVVIGGAFAL